METGAMLTKLLTRHGRISANASIAGNKKTANDKTYLRRWMKNGETTSSGPMISSSTGLSWRRGGENTPRSSASMEKFTRLSRKRKRDAKRSGSLTNKRFKKHNVTTKPSARNT